MLIAKAIYDNEGETSDELSFDRDDILAVHEIDYNGMEGWWLCSLRGKTGIVPANRLLVVHKIDVRSSSAAVKSPRFPSEVLRAMDYDFPKPLVPRKIGGSIDNLLNITYDDCSRGAGGGHGSRSGGSTPFGKVGTETSLAKKRGVSIGNLLHSSELAEYAVPTSMSPNDYEVPRKNFGKKSGNSPDKSSSGKGMVLSSISSKHPKKTFDQASDTPKQRPPDCPSKRNLLAPELKVWNRDSCLADYDTPTSGAKAVSLQGTKNPAGKCQVSQQQPVSRSADTQAKSSTKAQRCEIVDPSFLSSLSEVQSAVTQITSYADKWRACTNPNTKLSIVKQVCVAVWKKLQVLILEFSKCLAKFKGRAALSPLDDRLGAIKVVTVELEKILNYISSCHPNDIHQHCIDYVSELVIIAKEIECHLDYCISFLNSDLGDLLTCPDKTAKSFGFSNSDDTGTPSECDKRQQQFRRVPALPPPRIAAVALKTSQNYEDDFSISSVNYSAKTPPYGRSFSYDHLSSDYDIPKNSSVLVGRNPVPGSDKMAAVLRTGDARSADMGHTKRNAVVVEQGRDTFNILQRRNPQSQMAPSKLIAERSTKSNLTYIRGNLDISNSVDYDYPTAPNGGITEETAAYIENSLDRSLDLEDPITAYDKRVLAFYSERLGAELSQLKDSCQAVCYRSAERAEGDGEKTLSAQIQTLVISAHKLVFVADALIKKLSGAALRKRLQTQALEIIDKTKSIAYLAKSSIVNSGANSNRQQLVEGTDKLLAAAFSFQDILIKGSK